MLTIQGVIDSIKQGEVLDTEKYEVKADKFGSIRSKAEREQFPIETKLFADYSFRIDACLFLQQNNRIGADLRDLIRLSGGAISEHRTRRLHVFLTMSDSMTEPPPNMLIIEPQWIFDSISKGEIL